MMAGNALLALPILLAAPLLALPPLAWAGQQTSSHDGNAPCWAEAASRHSVPVELLRAVAQVESSNRARVIAQNTNGSLDIGFMQVNDWWLPKLREYGIGKDELMDACTNLNVGAWILKQGIDRYGYNWQGIGAYGAGTDPKKDNVRMTYANKVFRALGQQHGTGTAGTAAPVAVAGVQPAESGRGRRGGQPRQQTATSRTTASSGGEQLVWSVFD
ncbi:MAG: lytic transglycosylase domain-containing protein [Thiothrix sp.]|uniref:lytic transglycosylase domain-containing protein n=1 Tax=Thiothrix sp. TaxID=1032 RepID=UPI00260B2D79|nr:lytic transglycosylase domain-containing protein [Thiothrix sp.]MDD5395008.1 lytic transglycosylase domain-containing protein [Thiothrix sp.]